MMHLTKVNYLVFDENHASCRPGRHARPEKHVTMRILMTQAEWNTIPAKICAVARHSKCIVAPVLTRRKYVIFTST